MSRQGCCGAITAHSRDCNLEFQLVVQVVVRKTACACVQARANRSSSALDDTAGAASPAHAGERAPPLPGPEPPASPVTPGGRVRPRPVHVLVRIAPFSVTTAGGKLVPHLCWTEQARWHSLKRGVSIQVPDVAVPPDESESSESLFGDSDTDSAVSSEAALESLVRHTVSVSAFVSTRFTVSVKRGLNWNHHV